MTPSFPRDGVSGKPGGIHGVRADGRKELVALTDGYRESTESWAGLLRDAKRRGMRAPVLAMGDGALGFWAVNGRIIWLTLIALFGATHGPVTTLWRAHTASGDRPGRPM